MTFSFISLVMLMNVLIAQLSNIYPEAERKAKIAANVNRTWIVANIERYTWRFWSCKLPQVLNHMLMFNICLLKFYKKLVIAPV